MPLAKAQDDCLEVHSKGRDSAKKASPVWRFPLSFNHFHNLVRFLTEGCEDSHIKKPKDIPGYLGYRGFHLGRPEGTT